MNGFTRNYFAEHTFGQTTLFGEMAYFHIFNDFLILFINRFVKYYKTKKHFCSQIFKLKLSLKKVTTIPILMTLKSKKCHDIFTRTEVFRTRS